jgi:endogenous inhibitor of DNA gyrase (YacG/DUF329 family)
MAKSETRKPIGTKITMGGRLEVNGQEEMILTSYCPKCDEPVYTPTDWKGDGPPLPAYSCKFMDCPGNLPNFTCPGCGWTLIASETSRHKKTCLAYSAAINGVPMPSKKPLFRTSPSLFWPGEHLNELSLYCPICEYSNTWTDMSESPMTLNQMLELARSHGWTVQNLGSEEEV